MTDETTPAASCCCGAEHATRTGTPGALSRRRAIGLGAVAGLAVPVLAACSSDDSGSASAESTAESGQVLGKASDVPVGSGVIYSDAGVVVTQPTKGQYEGFSAICTHQGCPVSQISADGIVCTCHGSVFDVSTGDVLEGPAPSPLDSVDITVKDGEVTIA
ncbi:Rieske (2Fe-2S) protein [Nocardioides sp. GY 10127]|uniref:Rieske (2Fe-2S) protein n=1 Tax=Nocardioides sp. GY 10127 TaxID=2569762 RepID=UPI0010A918DB|nr:Rieske (2Fe-2S) protein [Nocardioides sp. GY 10127]TIC86567.1 Rieske (2Fe-2S) protein [Nocardioides sp. GY 10127]